MAVYRLLCRSIALAAVVMASTVQVHRAAAQSATAPVELRYAATLSTSTLPMVYAQKNGLFAKRGLDVKIVQYADFDGVYTAARTGSVDVVSGGPSAIANLRNNGVPFRFARGTFLFLNDFLVSSGSELTDIKQLKGKKIGIFGGAAGNAANMFMAVMIQQYGFDPHIDAKVIYGAAGLLTEMLARGEIDVCVCNDPITSRELSRGHVKSLGELGALYASQHGGYHPFAGGFSESDSFAKAHPDAMGKLSDAWVESIQALEKDPGLWVTGMKEYLKIDDPPTANLMRERLVGSFPLEWTQKNVDNEIEVLKFVSAAAGRGFLTKIPDDLFEKPTSP